MIVVRLALHLTCVCRLNDGGRDESCRGDREVFAFCRSLSVHWFDEKESWVEAGPLLTDLRKMGSTAVRRYEASTSRETFVRLLSKCPTPRVCVCRSVRFILYAYVDAAALDVVPAMTFVIFADLLN